MDIPVVAPVTSEKGEHESPKVPFFKNKSSLGIVSALLALLLLFAVAGLYWWMTTKDGSVFPKNATVTVSLGFVPASPLVALNTDRTSFEANTLNALFPGKLVIDRVVTKKGEYLLILDPVNSIANVVMRSKGDSGGAFVAVTDSSTMKFDLSYDEKTDTLVYLSKKLATPEEFLVTRDWDVTTFSAGVEQVIGKGLHAEVVPGKDAVMAGTFAGVLSWIPLKGGNATVLMEREQAWTFGVHANGRELALYNPTAVQVDRIDLSRGPENTRVIESLASGSRPASLTYMRDKIVLALPDSAQSSTTFMIAGDTAKTIEVKNLYPDVPSAAYNLTIEL